MKNGTFIIIAVFLIFSNKSFGDENVQVNSFNDYINSSESPLESPVKVMHHNSKENPDKTDSKPALQGIPVKWKTCAIDSDCTSAAADCVTWEAVNKKYLTKISKDLNSCSESIDPGFQLQAVCIAGECKTTEKTTDVSWEDWLSEMREERK